MSETKWTPGPWRACKNSWQYTTVYAADATTVCRLDLEDWEVTEDTQEEMEAEQAKLACKIAAAPELYDALLIAWPALRRCGYRDDSREIVAVEAALSKARGEACR